MKFYTDKSKYPDYRLELVRVDKFMKVSVRRDGCIDLDNYFNRAFDDPDRRENDMDNIHICSIDNFIEHLLEIKKEAQVYFGEDWPL